MRRTLRSGRIRERGVAIIAVLITMVLLLAVGAAIAGLAINYSAYEAEIYRAGLQAIPRGQIEAALSLGMSRGLAIRRGVRTNPAIFSVAVLPLDSAMEVEALFEVS